MDVVLRLDKSARLARRLAAPRPAQATTTATAPDAMACAEQVLAVVPEAMDALRLAMRRHVGEQLSVQQFRCLRFIDVTPGATVGAIATLLGVTMPTASLTVDRLVRAGLVRHGNDPNDRRRRPLVMTASGRALLKDIRRDARLDLTETLREADPAALQTVHDGLVLLQRLLCQGRTEPMPADASAGGDARRLRSRRPAAPAAAPLTRPADRKAAAERATAAPDRAIASLDTNSKRPKRRRR